MSDKDKMLFSREFEIWRICGNKGDIPIEKLKEIRKFLNQGKRKKEVKPK